MKIGQGQCISSVMKACEREIKWKIIFAFSLLKLHILHQFCMCIGEGRGEELDFCGSLQLERAQPWLGYLFPALSHLKASWGTGNEWSPESNPLSSSVCADHLPCLAALRGKIFPSCCWKDFTDREWAQPGWFQRVPFVSRVYSILSLPSQSIRAAQILHLILSSQSCSLQQILILAPAGSDTFELSDMRLNVNLSRIIIGLYVISRIMESKC